ncbi:MAG: hypothetical protein ABIQ88_12080 [Chitinophagaceae bacterium]
MDDMKGKQIIRALRRKWISFSILSDTMIAAGVAFLLIMLANKMVGLSYWWACLFFPGVLAALLFIHRVWLVDEKAITQLLDENYPQLEESSGLLLKPAGALNMLEHLQYKKTSHALEAIESPFSISKKISLPFFVLAMALVTGMAVYKFPIKSIKNKSATVQPAAGSKPAAEKLLPQIAGNSITIRPPAYTKKPARQQQPFNLLAEEGSLLNWQIKTNIPVTQLLFIFNDKMKVALRATNAARTQWSIEKKVDSAGFYQLNIDGKLSELYKIEIVHDQTPVVHLQSPKQYTSIEMGEPQQVKINTAITDDYGIRDASITVTIASGSGEAVKFKEEKIPLQGFIAGKTNYQLQQLLSLPALGMHPGDELYFYIQATDNHRQQTRSDIYIVHLPDTAELMSLDGMANSLTLKPEYFRSQRQIIIESEQLLKDKDTISAADFKNRSNNLGIDQRLLRLRYGKFLGDEAESGETNIDAIGGVEDFSNADKVRDAFTDKHDNAEDATFYEPETKKQLRATLTEMWDAEIRLRTFTPKDALPFEYKALRLLKDLQQKSRAYVAKTNFKTTPLDLKKRLTGDLDKITEPLLQKDIVQEPDPLLRVRNALATLDQIRTTGNSATVSAEILQQANLQLHEKAVQQPGVYLHAVEALKRILNTLNRAGHPVNSDIEEAQHGLQQLLAAPAHLLTATKTSLRQALSKQYFDNLQKKQP